MAAAGNGNVLGIDINTTPMYPAVYTKANLIPGVISVGATNAAGSIAKYSNYGGWVVGGVSNEVGACPWGRAGKSCCLCRVKAAA